MFDLNSFWRAGVQGLVVLGGILLFCVPALGLADTEARDWLRRMAEARKHQNYDGVFIYGRGDEVNSVRIIHRFQDGMARERLLHLDGAVREVLREDDKVVRILPGDGSLEQGLPRGPFARSYDPGLPAIGEQYGVSLSGGGRVAGHQAIKLAVMARDEHRYSYLLWLDQNTALLLKSLILDKQGKVLERMQFTTLEIGGAIPDARLGIAMGGADSGRNLASQQARENRPEADEPRPRWQPAWLPPGFQQAPLPRDDAADSDDRSDHQLLYTDGLASFSLFIEPLGRAEPPAGASQLGATVAYATVRTLADQSFAITLVGEVPLGTARQVVDSLQPVVDSQPVKDPES